MDIEIDGYVCTFPCFALANRSPSGQAQFLVTQFEGKQCLVIFTDKHLAEESREKYSDTVIELISEISDPRELLLLLASQFPLLRGVAMDMNLETLLGRSLPIVDVLEACVNWMRETTSKEDHPDAPERLEPQ